VRIEAGDFFKTVPVGADAYLLSRILPTGARIDAAPSWRMSAKP